MATTYTEILSNHPPFPFNTDSEERIMWSTNFRARTAAMSIATLAFADDLAAIIVSQSLGTANVNLFIGPLAAIPTGDGPFITVLPTSGVAAAETQNGDRFFRPTAQVVVRGKSYTDTQQRANAIHNALHGLRDITV